MECWLGFFFHLLQEYPFLDTFQDENLGTKLQIYEIKAVLAQITSDVRLFHFTAVLLNVGRDSVVGIATRYRLDGRGIECRFQWPCGLRRGSSAARLLGSWVRIPPGESMFVLC